MGERTWKPPWSPGASVQQGQGAADKEEWDPGGTTVDQLTALYQAAFPAIGLILLPPWRREKQGGCKDRRILAGNPSDRPADGSDGWHLCEDPPGVPALHPTPPGRGSSPYKQPVAAEKGTLLPTTEPTRGTRRRTKTRARKESQMLTSRPGAEASGQVNILGKSVALLAVPEIMCVPHYLCTRS